MFEGFALEAIPLPGATLRVRHGGHGPPLVLLHGHPRTHATWHRVAPLLAENFTVVCPDLRGFGRSSKPPDRPGHAQASKREKAQDIVDLMAHLGFERFSLAGHDRGAYTALRAALDHPNRIEKLAILDAVPILEALERCTEHFARTWWHWFFYGQPDKPERAILADPNAWYGVTPDLRARMGEEAFHDFQQAIHDPETVHAMVEDYRAGLTTDREHDEEDREAGRQVRCPTLILWSRFDDMAELYGDVLNVWRPWAPDLRGHDIESGHHVAEEAPEELARALGAFFGG